MKRVLYLLVLVIAAVSFSACNSESEAPDNYNKQTTIVFMPWSGSANGYQGLYSYFMQNLDSIEGAILKAGRMNGRVLVFFSTSAESSSLYEITLENKQIHHKTIKSYTGNLYTTANGIAEILSDVKSNAFALNYAMVIGCHGMGWTFKNDWTDYPYAAKQRRDASSITKKGSTNLWHPTRFYGSVDDLNSYATDIETLDAGIREAGLKMQYILFDDCYMANVETAYQLKDVTNFLVGSTSEIMAEGMPYQSMWTSLASPTPAYETITAAFHQFYSKFNPPCGTLSVIDCRKLDRLAAQMKLINEKYQFDSNDLDSLQTLDGFDQSIFFDMKDYVEHLCKDNDMLNDFNALLTQTVKSTVHTDSIYSAIYPFRGGLFIKINRFSGITISDPSINRVALKGKEKTSWWKASH